MTVPPPWARPASDGTCTAEIRTTPFDAASVVTLDGLNGNDRWAVEKTSLGAGTVKGDACAFSISLNVPSDGGPAQEYRLTVESSTRSLMVTWDYPASVVESGTPLVMPLTDHVLKY